MLVGSGMRTICAVFELVSRDVVFSYRILRGEPAVAKTIGILTGGGDVPGLNPCIKAVVNRAIDAGYDVIGIRRGWVGLLHFKPNEPESFSEVYMPLEKQPVRTIDRTGGTVFHTSRPNPSKVRPNE